MGTRSGRSGSWLWLRFSRRCYRLFAFHLRIVLQARSEYFPARFAGGHAADGGRTAAAAQVREWPGGTLRSAEGLGTLVRRTDGEPSLLSCAGLFSLAARQPVLDRFTHGDFGHLRARHRRHRRSLRKTGGTYFRDCASRRRRSFASVWNGSQAAAARPLPRARLAPNPAYPCPARQETS